MSKLKKFSPTIRTEQEVKFETNYNSTLDQLADKDGKIKTKLNESSVIQALSHKLYRNAESGFRELLNNEIRACQIARDQHKAKPYIKVSLDTLQRKLIIQGFNSQGITEEVFKILTEIGTSTVESKKDGRIPFGMGFFGFLKLSDIAMIQTRCIENNDCYGFMAKGGLFFQKIQQPNFSETGTKIWLTLKPKTNYEKIINVLIEASKVSGIPTHFELNAHKGKICGYGSGIHELKSTTYQKIFNNTLENSENSYLKAHINNDEIEAFISIGIDSYGELDNARKKELFLINSPIQAVLDEDDYDDYDYDTGKNNRLNEDENYNYDDQDNDQNERDDKDYKAVKSSKIDEIRFSSIVINMKKENLFPPHQDRERLTPNAEKKLRGIVIELYHKAVKSMKPCKTLNEWFKHEHKYFISYDGNKGKGFGDLMDNNTQKLQKFLNENYWNVVGKSRTEVLKEQIKEYDSEKEYNTKTKLFYVEKKDSRIKRILDEHLSNHFLTYLYEEGNYSECKRNNSKMTKKAILDQFNKKKKQLLDFGFIEARDYIKEKGFKLKTEPRAKKELDNSKTWIKLHNNQYDHHATDVSLTGNEVRAHLDKIFRVDDWGKYQALSARFNQLYFVMESPSNRDSKLLTPEQHQEAMKDEIFITNHGDLTVEQILKFNAKIKYEHKIPIKISCEELMQESSGYYNREKTVKRDFNSKLVERVDKSKLYIIGKPEFMRKKDSNIVMNDYEKNYLALSKLTVLLEYNNFKYSINDDNLDNYYQSSLKKLAKKTDKLSNGLDRDNFNSTQQYENYLFTLEKIDKEITNKTLREIFAETHDEEDYFTRNEQIFQLQKELRGKKRK